MKTSKLPAMKSSLATSQQMSAMLRALRAESDLTVQHDKAAGTAVAYVTNRSLTVFSALQKGAGQPWIVRMMDGLLSLS